MGVYNKNRDNNMCIKDEINEQKAKMKGQPLSVKLAYFKDYYLKLTIAVIICIAFIISIIVSVLSGPEDTAFACYFINNTGSVSDTTLSDNFANVMDIDTSKHDVYIDTSIHYSSGNEDPYAYVSIEKIMAIMSTGELDVIVGDETVADYYGNGDCFVDISTVLPEDLKQQFADKYYYYTNDEGETFPIGIYIDDSPVLAEYGYYSHTKPIFGIIANSGNVDNAISFLRYIYNQDINN